MVGGNWWVLVVEDSWSSVLLVVECDWKWLAVVVVDGIRNQLDARQVEAIVEDTLSLIICTFCSKIRHMYKLNIL